MNPNIHRLRPTRPDAIPNVIFTLLIINGLVFAAQWLLPRTMYELFALFPLQDSRFMPWQIVTYGFMHSQTTLMHIIFNMLMLWMFGRDLERLMGPQRFLTYYMTCVAGAGLVQLLVGIYQGNDAAVVLGASGGVFGILLAYGMHFPNRTLMLIFPPIPMKAKYFVIMLGLFELTIGLSGVRNGIANFAHLGGMLFGFFLIRHWARGRVR